MTDDGNGGCLAGRTIPFRPEAPARANTRTPSVWPEAPVAMPTPTAVELPPRMLAPVVSPCRYLMRAIWTPFCKIPLKAAFMFAAIWASVPVTIWFDGNAVEALLWVPA